MRKQNIECLKEWILLKKKSKLYPFGKKKSQYNKK